MAREDTRSRDDVVSLDDEDAIDVGLFASGPATIVESLFTTYDYQGTSKNPPTVWLIVYERGKGKDKETYEQPYGLGKGWHAILDGNAIKSNRGLKSLPRNCNAIRHLVGPFKDAVRKSPFADQINFRVGNPRALEGMQVEVERVDQQERHIDSGREGGRNSRGRARGDNDDRGPGTILEIREVLALGNGNGASGGTSKKKRDEDEDEDEQPKRRSKPAQDDDEDRPSSRKRGTVRDEKSDDDEDDDEDEDEGNGQDKEQTRGKSRASTSAAGLDLDEDAIEAVILAVERGPVKLADLEKKLLPFLKGHKQKDEVIDLATSQKFLQKERGWTFDGKVIDAEKDDEDDDKASDRARSSSSGRSSARR